jgi:4-azaleucine resistance transporter AzlC
LSVKKQAMMTMALKGIVDMLPLNLAVLPWGILCGYLAIQRDFSVMEALLMPLLVFAGAAQLVATELIGNNAPLATILFTVFIISSRHFLYGLALRDKIKTLSLTKRLSIAFVLTDELFALSTSKKSLQGKLRLAYGLAAGVSFYLGWLLWNIIGIIAGSYLPDLTSLGLDFAIAATFIALVVPTITTIPVFVTVVVAAALSVIFKLWHWQLDLVMASVIAMGCGYISLQIQEKFQSVEIIQERVS